MQLREYARAVIGGRHLDDKLRPPPDELLDSAPGSAEVWSRPERDASLAIRPATEVKVPPLQGMKDVNQRPRILHAMANHELQAIELFAWAVLAFPDTPTSFRRGLVAILAEEQRHFELYRQRLRAHGMEFGDLGVTGYFWNRAEAIRSPLQFSCVMGLTFENANLDFAREFSAAARECGDVETAQAIDVVHADEIRHVAFGWRWLSRWKRPDDTMWQAYLDNLERPLGPERARGKTFDADDRRAAGLDEEFIAKLEATAPKRPGGAPR